MWAREMLQPVVARLNGNIKKTLPASESGIFFLDEAVKNQPVPLPTGNPKPSQET